MVEPGYVDERGAPLVTLSRSTHIYCFSALPVFLKCKIMSSAHAYCSILGIVDPLYIDKRGDPCHIIEVLPLHYKMVDPLYNDNTGDPLSHYLGQPRLLFLKCIDGDVIRPRLLFQKFSIVLKVHDDSSGGSAHPNCARTSPPSTTLLHYLELRI